jgi:hypothetical protein
MKKLSALGFVLATGLLCSTPVTVDWSPAKLPSLSLDTADARVGRPLTPMSIGAHTTAPPLPAPRVTASTTIIIVRRAGTRLIRRADRCKSQLQQRRLLGRRLFFRSIVVVPNLG